MQDVVGGGDGVAGYWWPGRQAVTAWRGPVVGMAGGAVTGLGSESGKLPSA